MKPTLLVLTLALILTATRAGAADLWTLLGNGDSTLPGSDVVYVLSSADGLHLNVGLKFGELKGDGYASPTLTAFKFTGNLNAGELRLLADNVIKISAACFNTDASRGPAIRSWVLSNDAKEEHLYYTAGTHFAEKGFGPLQLALEKRVNGRGHSVSVYLSRKGIPGQTPWIKSCITSG